MRPGLLRRVERIREGLRRLREVAEVPRDQYLSSELLKLATERDLQVVIEALLDIGHAIISAQDWRIPRTYREVAEILYEYGVLTGEERDVLTKLAGLRNVLVHLYYLEVDHELLHRSLPEIVKWVEYLLQKLLKYVREQGIDPVLP